jgi:hypothetical protein
VAPLPSERKHWWLTNRKVGSLPLSLSHVYTHKQISCGFVYLLFVFVFVFLAMLKIGTSFFFGLGKEYRVSCSMVLSIEHCLFLQ